MLWCNEVMISSATWTWRRSFAETVFDFIRHVAPWFYGNANRQAARSWQEGERKGTQTREWKASKEHTEIFFFLILGFEAFAASDASSDREEQSEPKARLSSSYGLPCVAQVTFFHRGRDYADAARGSVLSTSLWGQTKMGERERGFFDAVYPSLPRPTHSLRLRFLPPLINHLCVWVCLKLWIRTYSNGFDIKRAAEVLSRVCVCVCMRRIQGHNIQARCISQTSRDVIL